MEPKLAMWNIIAGKNQGQVVNRDKGTGSGEQCWKQEQNVGLKTKTKTAIARLFTRPKKS